MKPVTLFVFLACGFVALVALVGIFGGHTDNEEAITTMQKAGFKDVAVTNVSYGGVWNGCAKGDRFSYDVRAINPAGQWMTATVCCGLVKHCTIRY